MLLLLLKHKVDFILFGGYAVIYYGYERTTGDMDIWLKPDNTNRTKLIKALSEHGIRKDDLNILETFDFSKVQVFFIGEKPSRIDFLTTVQGVSYEEADREKVYFPLEDQQVPVIQYYHLIRTKITSSRPKDKADIDELQKINQFKNKS